MKVFEGNTRNIFVASWVSPPEDTHHQSQDSLQNNPRSHSGWNLLRPLRNWLDNLQVCNRQFAHRVCQLIPAQCPFERDVKLFGKILLHIPPMCKLNPLYEEVVGLRFRALCYLADECGEDISQYC
ncbi:MAG: nitrogenase [Sphaerospermopsis sp. SIO1G2]|nr:nitrogenase [Sphaerospermopsis sp. SIO1G1]NET73115.1 nitrogenase [Sphaerospermopsis sp. SIO1G2]